VATISGISPPMALPERRNLTPRMPVSIGRAGRLEVGAPDVDVAGRASQLLDNDCSKKESYTNSLRAKREGSHG
jgi:hypothetical protein